LSNYILAYDSGCGPCRRFKIVVDFFDVSHQIDFVSLTDADNFGLLNKIPQPQRYKSFHLIFPNGDIQSGAQALLDVISIFPFGHRISKLLMLIPGYKGVIIFLYSALSRSHDRGSCELNHEKPVEK
jgi:predicted DCC family thiol-disulfide oxidoreductase YuxK